VGTRAIEIDGAVFHLSACSGDPALSDRALDIGLACLREAAEDVAGDLGLISQGSLDILPRSEVARTVMEAARTAVHAGHPDHSISAARYALAGALADSVLTKMESVGPLTSAYVVSGECGAFSIKLDAVLDVPSELRGALWLEVIHGLRPGIVKGGVAVAGARVPAKFASGADGDADAVAIYARSGAEAALSAILVADSVGLSETAKRQAIPATEDIWDALSKGVRVLSPLREANLVRTGVLALRGRGRSIGTIAEDRLLRFGVSEWR
jgi:ApbE superfamily uncharacterized protein (UPF0280 family)